MRKLAVACQIFALALAVTLALPSQSQNDSSDENIHGSSTSGPLSALPADDKNASTDPTLSLDYEKYMSEEKIAQSLQLLSRTCNKHPKGNCSLVSIGATYEGRKLRLLRIGTRQKWQRQPEDTKSPVEQFDSDDNATSGFPSNARSVWIDGGTHAREWMSPAVALLLADALVTAGVGGSDPALEQLVTSHDVYVMPLFNPDGYEYSRNVNIFWRKNRQPDGGELDGCIGIDLNRNYGFHWGQVNGSSSDPCSDAYRGSSSFSGFETDAERNFFDEHAGEFLLYLSLHSYGSVVMYPYGYSLKARMSPRKTRETRCVACRAGRVMATRQGRSYRCGSLTDLLNYSCSGSSIDWTEGTGRAKYSLGIELPGRDADRGFRFWMPANYTRSIGLELLDGLKEMLRVARGVARNGTEFLDASDC